MTKTFNGLKIGLASSISIAIAEFLELDFSVSAGVVAILTIAPTKAETIKSVYDRFASFIVALIISYVFFEQIGYNFNAFYIYLIIFIIICKHRNWSSSIAINSVLISHFLTFGDMNIETLSNEAIIFAIGSILGIVVNLHLHANDDYMKKMQIDIDIQVKQILSRMAERVSNHSLGYYNGTCFKSIKKSIRTASEIAEENSLNRFIKNNDLKDFEYIKSKEEEVYILYNIYKRLKHLNTSPVTSQSIADFINKLSDSYNNMYADLHELLDEFYILRREIRKSPLPVERNEFENRAELYVVLEDMEEYLLLLIRNKPISNAFHLLHKF